MEPAEFDGMSVEEQQAYFEGMLSEPLSPDERGRLYDGLKEGEAAQGRELWKRSWDAGNLPRILVQNSPASATPACDGKHLVVYLSTLGLLGLDAADGRE